MRTLFKNILTVTAMVAATHVAAQVTFYEQEGFHGRSFSTDKQVDNFERYGFNDRASSVVVLGERREVCEDMAFGGHCVVLRAGRYPSLAAMGLNDRISSVRPVGRNDRVDDNRYAPPPQPVYDNRRRNNERLYEAEVTSVRAVVGAPQQRCWMEPEQVSQSDNNSANIPGALVGALLGGVLGHQVGGGRGKDLATAGGAVGGAVLGANVGRYGAQPPAPAQNVQRCTTEPASNRPEYWDVTYSFRGQEHRIQTTTPPGRTVTVNRQGEPRA